MSAFGSSLINKSTKKFAPKVPLQRKPVAAPTAPAASVSATSASTPTPQTGARSEDEPRSEDGRQPAATVEQTRPIGSTVLDEERDVIRTNSTINHVTENTGETDFDNERPHKRRRVDPGDDHAPVTESSRPASPIRVNISEQDNHHATAIATSSVPQPSSSDLNNQSASNVEPEPQEPLHVSNLDRREQTVAEPLLNPPSPKNVPSSTNDSQPSKVESQRGAAEVGGMEEVSSREHHEGSGSPAANTASHTAFEAPQSIDEASVRTLVSAVIALGGAEEEAPQQSMPRNIQTDSVETEGGNDGIVEPERSDQQAVGAASLKAKKPRQPRKKKTMPATIGHNPEEDHTSQTLDSAQSVKPRKQRQPRKKKDVSATAHEQQQELGTDEPVTSPPSARNRARRKPRQSNAVQSEAVTTEGIVNESGAVTEVADPPAGENATEETNTSHRQRRKGRAKTPEGAEEHEHSTDKVTMFDLCKDTRQGKKSQRETDMQAIDWTEVAKRRKEAEMQARVARADGAAHEEQEREEEIEQQRGQGVRGPQLKLINGQIVVDSESLVVQRQAAGPGNGAAGAAIEESDLTRRITSHSWMFDSRRDVEERNPWAAKSDPWTEEQTNQFYNALRMFGTDFFIISQMFVGKSRRMIKQKFVREERAAPDRIRAALIGEQVPMDMEVYCAATGKQESDFKDPEQLEQELKELDENQKTEIEQKKVEMVEKAKEKQELAKSRAEAAKMRKKKGPTSKRAPRSKEMYAQAGGATEIDVEA